MTEREEFKAWLEKNRSILVGRTPDEVAYLARLGGFSEEVVYSELSHFDTSIRGGNFDEKMKFESHRELMAVKKHCGVSLLKQWSDLYNYLNFGTSFDDSL